MLPYCGLEGGIWLPSTHYHKRVDHCKSLLLSNVWPEVSGYEWVGLWH